MRRYPRPLAFLVAALAALAQAGCCHWWHHGHRCCYTPAGPGPAGVAPAEAPALLPGAALRPPSAP
jgi:hypothetical protein